MRSTRPLHKNKERKLPFVIFEAQVEAARAD